MACRRATCRSIAEASLNVELRKAGTEPESFPFPEFLSSNFKSWNEDWVTEAAREGKERHRAEDLFFSVTLCVSSDALCDMARCWNEDSSYFPARPRPARVYAEFHINWVGVLTLRDLCVRVQK